MSPSSRRDLVAITVVLGALAGCGDDGGVGNNNNSTCFDCNLCDGVDCGEHGACRNLNTFATCECEPGYHPEGLACVADGTNHPPILTNLPTTVTAEVGNAGTFTVTAVDPDGDACTYEVEDSTCTFTPAVDLETGLLSFTCGAVVETCEAQIQVTDDASPPAFDSDTLTILCGSG
jgi:hypothetical protein